MSKYEIKYTTQFKKDYKLAKRRGLDIEVLVLTLARTGTHSDLSLIHISEPTRRS